MPFRIRPPDERADQLVLTTPSTPKGQLAPAHGTDLGPEVRRILVALGMPEVRAATMHVSAVTKISDLRDSGRHPGAFARDLSDAIGIKVGPDDALLDVAARLRGRRGP